MNKKISICLVAVILSFCSSLSIAQTLMCGKDLRTTFTQQTRDKLARDGGNIKNGYGRFWKIEKRGVEPSWLLGTMHAGDVDLVKMSTQEMQAFHQAQRVVLELTEVADPKGEAIIKAIMAYPNLVMYQNNDNLKKHISDIQFHQFELILKNHGIVYARVQTMRPWFLWAVLSLPNCPALENGHRLKSFDTRLGLDALLQGKELIGLETVKEQISAFAALPDSFYIQSIVELIGNETLSKDQFATMGKLYIERKIGEIVALFDYYSQETITESDLQKFKTVLLHKRNILMAQRAEPYLKKGNSFIAVGALHLVGDTGLVEAFRRGGYKVTSIP